VLDAFGRFILEPRGFFAVEDDRAARQLIALSRMIAASPALLAREEHIFARYTRTLASLVAEEVKAPDGDLRPLVAANALIGVHRGLIDYVRERLKSPDVDRRRLARDYRRRGLEALALLRDGLGEYARKP
jgi:hypothetical protein